MKTFSMDSGELIPSDIADYQEQLLYAGWIPGLDCLPQQQHAKAMPVDLACVNAETFLNRMYEIPH